MTTQEKRFIRREIINLCLQHSNKSNIRAFVRYYERANYGETLNIY